MTKTKPKLDFESAKAQYVHRFTMEHVPTWARKRRDNGSYYAPQFRSDREWFENTVFPPHNGARKYCTSTNLSWPLGTALDKPFEVVAHA